MQEVVYEIPSRWKVVCVVGGLLFVVSEKYKEQPQDKIVAAGGLDAMEAAKSLLSATLERTDTTAGR